MYAIETIPLIQQQVKQVWYADDVMAGGKLIHLSSWWDQRAEQCKNYEYYANALTWLVVKQEHLSLANKIFDGSGFQITIEGKPTCLGTRTWNKVKE